MNLSNKDEICDECGKHCDKVFLSKETADYYVCNDCLKDEDTDKQNNSINFDLREFDVYLCKIYCQKDRELIIKAIQEFIKENSNA